MSEHDESKLPKWAKDRMRELRAEVDRLKAVENRWGGKPVPISNGTGGVLNLACHGAMDGECIWSECPQLRDGEPHKTGRHCPLDRRSDDDSC